MPGLDADFDSESDLNADFDAERDEVRTKHAKTWPFTGKGASGGWGYEDPGMINALATKLGQGLMKEGQDEGAGQTARALLLKTKQPKVRLVEVAPGKKVWERYEAEPGGGQFGPEDLAEAVREDVRGKQGAADQHYPWLGGAAQVVGDAGGDAAMAAAGVPALGAAYQTLVGGARGFLGSDSDDTTDKALSTGLGGLFGLGFSQLPQAAAWVSSSRPVQAIAKSAAGKSAKEILGKAIRAPGELMDRAGISMGRRVLSGAKGLKAEEALPDDSVREAMDAGALQLFGTTKGAAKRLEKVREALGDQYAQIVRGLEAKGVTGPEARGVANEWLEKAAKEDAESLGSNVPQLYMDRAEEILSKAPGGRLGLSQAEGMKRSLQKQAKYGKFEETPLNEAKRDIAADLRGGIERQVREAAETTTDPALRDLATQFEPVKKRLARLIPADDHVYQEANRIASRKGLPLSELVAGSTAYGATGDILKTALVLGGTHLLRTRGGSTGAVAARGLGKGWLAAVENAPQLFGEFGAVISGQKTPEARVAMAEELAQRYPAFAQMLEEFGGEDGPTPEAKAPRPGDALRGVALGK